MAAIPQPPPKPHNLTVIDEDPLYKDFIVFYPNMSEKHKGEHVDLSWPVRSVRMDSTGVSNGHWRLVLSHDNVGDRRTFFNMKAEPHKNFFGQLKIGPANLGSYGYDLTVVNPDTTLESYIHALLHPSASDVDQVHADKPLCWFKYNSALGTAGCRHWTESAAKALFRAGLLQGDHRGEVETIILHEGTSIEKGNLANPKGTFLTARPAEADYLWSVKEK